MYRSMRCADHSSRGVVPCMCVCVCVCVCVSLSVINATITLYTDNEHVEYLEEAALTFRHRASCILGQAFHYSPENAFYLFNQQIYFII